MQPTLSEQAYRHLRRLIVELDYAPGDVLREEAIQARIGIGRTPVREALQRLAREHFVTVIPRRGMFVSGIDVSELSMLFETRTVLEPYAAQLAASRGTAAHWESMSAALHRTNTTPRPNRAELMSIDRTCHEIMWTAAGNRFLVDTLDMLYAQSDRLWHLHLAGVSDTSQAVAEHHEILAALRERDTDRAASLVEAHVREFNDQIRRAVASQLESPLAD